LRAIRRRRGLTLSQTATKAGISESFLSQIERSKAGASIPTLQRVAAALNVAMSDLFEPDGVRRSKVLKRADRPLLEFFELGRKYLVTPRPLDHLEVLFGEMDPGSDTQAITHGDSEEVFIVIRGEIRLFLDGEQFVMETGDSIDYRSSVPHRAVNVGDDVAEVLWIISPPSY